ncbi:transcription termination antitermination factor : Transcription termination/antitermination protein NusG OS=Planctomyces maris DSM 8797 GN=nusG PE=3 SV=1: NusG [Gemmata massiliana]|uniref:Transcription termination/antitermination protein NusG n=1 Tax=Gemmata massiliana TaxID=1210884 RepID=A0A6P2D5S2_9BACT|nr:transcription termination/antitermination protein NusG [Gemmata massiliana]VTR96641.1 transcription termination antitermination factor : Transcription termination/antitermination protein NusG OS=Planctomyces maris DSM 8797 GN=nusG PE=3 SV=1: NusG [Gemmata massiliana]
MTEDTTDVPATNEPEPATPVVDAQSNDAVSAPAPAESEAQELIEPGDQLAESVAEAEAAPEMAEESQPTKKPRAARGSESEEEDEEPGPVPASDDDDEPAAEPVPESKKKWYAIKVQSGREDTIKAAILRKVAIEGLEEYFGQIMIPYEEVIEKKAVKVKDKKTGDTVTVERKVTRKRKKFQGYLFAELEFNDRILYLFRETSGVGDFLNLRNKPNEAPTPEPMSDQEVQQMLTGEKQAGVDNKGKKIKIEFEKGDRVRIREGSFANSEGEVTAISEPKDPTDAPKITVVVTFWGRPLPVELEYWQVAKV